MLTPKQVKEIKEHLDKAQNPLIFYDNDPDGLCAFLLARRYLGRGKGVAVKSYPNLNAQYAQRAQDLNADYVFVFDKPLISLEFLQEIDRLQLPLVIIDHHAVAIEGLPKNASYYNPAFNKGKNKSTEPVTALLYQVLTRKEDLWIAIMGCIADHHLPAFAKEFAKHYPEFWGKAKEPFDAYYGTEIGRLAQSLSFGLKDSVSNVIAFQNFLISAQSPNDILAELESNISFRNRYTEIKKKYDALMESARQNSAKKLLFFSYAGELSISAELANELSYRYQKKYIAVAYQKDTMTNVSLRGKNVRALLEKLLPQFPGASGGGHTDAVGARIPTEDIERFKACLEHEIAA